MHLQSININSKQQIHVIKIDHGKLCSHFNTTEFQLLIKKPFDSFQATVQINFWYILFHGILY